MLVQQKNWDFVLFILIFQIQIKHSEDFLVLKLDYAGMDHPIQIDLYKFQWLLTPIPLIKIKFNQNEKINPIKKSPLNPKLITRGIRNIEGKCLNIFWGFPLYL